MNRTLNEKLSAANNRLTEAAKALPARTAPGSPEAHAAWHISQAKRSIKLAGEALDGEAASAE